MLLVMLLSMCAAALAASAQRDERLYKLEDAQSHFEQFVQEYGRQYADDREKQMRYEIFEQNLKEINEMNMMNEDAVYGITRFSDLTKEEFTNMYTGLAPVSIKCTLLMNSSRPITVDAGVTNCKNQVIGGPGSEQISDIPDSFDWRDKNVVTKVKDQGSCGSCWTFSTTGNIEGQYAIKHKQLLEFAEQQLIDCDKNNKGCRGGLLSLSFGGLVDIGGIMTEQDYPYAGREGTCNFDKGKAKAKLNGCISYELKDEEKLRELLYKQGPISIAIDAGCLFLHQYKGGIATGNKFSGLNHGVLLVGYGQDADKPYWIIKNSWGSYWGEKGYFKVKRGVNSCMMMNPCAATSLVD